PNTASGTAGRSGGRGGSVRAGRASRTRRSRRPGHRVRGSAARTRRRRRRAAPRRAGSRAVVLLASLTPVSVEPRAWFLLVLQVEPRDVGTAREAEERLGAYRVGRARRRELRPEHAEHVRLVGDGPHRVEGPGLPHLLGELAVDVLVGLLPNGLDSARAARL